jgi:hypothetical protein
MLKEDGRIHWSLLNSVSYAGYKPEYKDRGHYGSAMIGVEVDHQLKRFKFGDDPVWLNWHLTYSYLFDKLNFHVSEDRVVSINDEWNLGMALSLGSKKIKIWFIEFEQIGLSFKRSSNGEYEAITFNLRSPFTE